jgi:hypothetical protein
VEGEKMNINDSEFKRLKELEAETLLIISIERRENK